MNERMFIDSVRNYAREAKRRNKSYAVPVQTLLKLHQDWLEKNVTDDGARQAYIDRALRVVAQEYAPVDRDFVLGDVG
jgi:hypothetical protein